MSNVNDYNVIMVPVGKIRPNPYQPRKGFDKMMLAQLANSIKQYGVMQPINVRAINKDTYEVIAGERRLRASKLAGVTEVPVIIMDVNDKDSAVLALVENLQRENLTYFEEAEGYANLMDDYSLTQEEIAKQVGRSQSTIANKMRLLKLDESVIKLLADNKLSERHARALLKLPTEEMRLKVLNKVIIENLNVKKTEELIEKTLSKAINKNQDKKDEERVVKRYLNDIRIFTNTIKQTVDTMRSSGVNVDYKIIEEDDNYNISIKIPMNKK